MNSWATGFGGMDILFWIVLVLAKYLFSKPSGCERSPRMRREESI
jgi:hypothetical protein